MARPSITVEIGFMTTPTFGDGFVLDSTTQGRLDSLTYRLGGPEWTDITAYTSECTIDRGRSRELDQFDAGTCSLVLRNESRRFDPTNASGPYYGGIAIRNPVRITVNSSLAFYGFVEDYGVEFSGPRVSQATVSASDAFSLLAQSQIAARTPNAEKSGSRIRWVLSRSEVRFPAEYTGVVNTGSATLGNFAISEGTNTLDYLQSIADAERGRLYMQKDGTLRFRGRTNVPSLTAASFTDTAGGIPYQDISYEYGSEQFYNYVSVANAAASPTAQTAENSASIMAYGMRGLNKTGMLLSSNAQCLSMATALLGQYGQPEFRVSAITVNLDRLTSTQQNTILGLEISDLITVQLTPPGGGSAILKVARIEGISHARSVNTHDLALQLSTINGSPLVLGDATFGLAGTGTLAY